MAKRFVRVSLATKFRLVFGLAVLAIIAAALALPWYFMEALAVQGVERAGAEISRMGLNEWVIKHTDSQGRDLPSDLPAYYASYAASGSPREIEGRQGPRFLSLTGDTKLETSARRARKEFERSKSAIALYSLPGEHDRPVFHLFRALRVEDNCISCHGVGGAADVPKYELGQLVGMIHVTLPASSTTSTLVWWTRGSIIAGGALAALLASIVFAIITQRLILRPVRHLRNLADKVTEGDLSVRSTVQTGDELQRLGESINEMLTAIGDQHEKLRAANRALDLKMHELGEANVTLAQANQVKNEFLANISHELRTPLNSIIGFGDLLCESPDERVSRYGSNITTAAKNLLAMINDLLDIAKIEAGKSEVRLDRVSLTDTCQTLEALMQPLAQKKQLDLSVQLDVQIPLIVTDGGKVQQILYNLLSNAIKFTPPGGKVTLTSGLNRSHGSGDGQEAFVSVKDTGPGIAEADQIHIFDKFYQVDRTLTREAAGTGLGLAIARELGALLGGRITLKSEPGNGADFTLTLPVDGPQRAIRTPTVAS